jgi:predicted aspartyl protease
METTVMKTNRSLFCAFVQIAVLLSFATVPGFAGSQVTVSMRPYKGTRTVVAVKVNGAGPYDLMVDTGATVTLLDTAMFHELGLRAEGLSQITSAAGATSQIRSVVNEITLDCFSVRNIAVVSLPAPVAGSGYGAVRGILGENFLRHFDILFDNEHRKLTLDAGQGLAESLSGERLPVTFPSLPREDDNRYRPTIRVTAEAYGPASLLLDSGATSIMLLQWGGKLQGQVYLARVRTVNGSIDCRVADDRLHLGKKMLDDGRILNCQSATVKPQDREGMLPTAIFKQIFISHSGSFVVIDPRKRFDAPREIAVVAPLPR